MPITPFPNGISSFGIPVVGSGVAIPSTTGTYFFVHSGTGSSTNDGKSPTQAVASIDQAINLCTANTGDVILVMPGHAETITAAAGIDADVAGIFIVGLGSGENRPVVTFGTATTADLDVDAANITISNIVFKNNIDAQALMIDVNAAGFTISDCEFLEGSAKQWLTAIDVNGGSANACDRTTIRRCRFKSTSAGADNAIKLAEVADQVLIEDCIIDGDFNDAGIHNPTGKVLTNLVLRRNLVRNRQTGDHAIELVSACTGEATDNRLFADTPGLVFDSGSLFCAGNLEQNQIDSAAVPSPAGLSGPEAWIRVDKAAATLPATTTQNIFTIAGGRVLVKLLLGEVSTVVQNQLCNLKVTSAPTTGTAVDIASNLNIQAFEAGALLQVEGDGTALVGAAAGAGAVNAANPTEFVLPIGSVRIETSATNTGATKWTMLYRPLDSSARVVSA